MHIPKGTTAESGVLPFFSALERSDGDTYDRDRWLYVPDFYSEYRYILGTKGKNPLIAVGVNPSTARPDDLDNTLKSVERIALANGYDSFIMFNVYAQRATAPEDMERECNLELHQENLKAFDYILGLCAPNPPSVWAAWGAVLEVRSYLPRCVMDMIEVGRQYGTHWYSAGPLSKKNGHPHHPLYLRKDTPLDSFDVDYYCQNLITYITKKEKRKTR